MKNLEMWVGKVVLLLLGSLLCMGIFALGLLILKNITCFIVAHTWAVVPLVALDTALLTREFYQKK
ncbi:MAG: hypothetical protein II669_05495 [Elusimicrobia bacterium]|nr:hypothetical protein [Elusimicrobiota bacterium]